MAADESESKSSSRGYRSSGTQSTGLAARTQDRRTQDRGATADHGATPDYVTVEIYDQVYHLSGQDLAQVSQQARRVDAKMRAVARQGKTVDSLRVAVLAALNLADELARAEERLRELSRDRSASDARAAGNPRNRLNRQPEAADANLRDRATRLRGLLDSVLVEERKTERKTAS